jgi:hypothetical protein
MTRLEHLSQFSNAVLSPELNTCEFPMKKGGSGYAVNLPKKGEWRADETAFCKAWSEQQSALIGEFGAVFEMVLAKQLFGESNATH